MLWWTLRQLKSENWKRRKRAVEKLGRSKDTRVIELLIIALMDWCSDVRKAAEDALEAIDPNWPKSDIARASIELLVSSLSKKSTEADWERRKEATVKRALKRIDPNWENSEGARAAIYQLVNDLGHGDGLVRSNAARILKEIDPNWAKSKEAKAAVFDLTWLFGAKRTDSRRRIDIANALGEIGDSRAFEALASIYNYNENKYRILYTDEEKAVVEALGKIGDARAITPLLESIARTGSSYPYHDEQRLCYAAIIQSLERLMRMALSEISSEDLRVASNLQDKVGHVSINPSAYTCHGGGLDEYKKVSMSCGQIRQLARQELIRRGLKA